jgi:phosphoribosylamine--glycine ligase
MGAYSPAPVVTAEVHAGILREILLPLLNGLKRQNICYRGLIYAGLMITKEGPKVIEFNARFGDPECQPIMMRLKSDLLPLLEATIDGKLDQAEAEWYEDPAVCVVLTANGYPGSYDKGKEIHGLEKLANWQRASSFTPAPPKKLTAGSPPAAGSWASPPAAKRWPSGRRSLPSCRRISWAGMHYRRTLPAVR